jgi:hypothetical protein
MARTRVASPFSLPVGEMGAPVPVRAKEWVRERRRVRVAPAELCPWSAPTPHLNPLPLAEGRGETNGMGLTIGEHYRSLGIALKSYCQRHQRCAKIKAIQLHNYEIA